MNSIEKDLHVLAEAHTIQKDVERGKKPSAKDFLKTLIEAEAIERHPERLKQIKTLAKEKLEKRRIRKEKAKERATKQIEEIKRKRGEGRPPETEAKKEPAKQAMAGSRPEPESKPEGKTDFRD